MKPDQFLCFRANVSGNNSDTIERESSFFYKKRLDFRPIRYIGQNHPCMDSIQLKPHRSTQNILV